MFENETIKYRQMYFDMEGTIRQEKYVINREMTAQEQEQYETLVADSNQMTIFDYMKS
ncbi:MAG: hypothetical protein IKP29_08645 [Pseudobutyrivibrio sp.]|nr:hypothetical protein [Pseudobutyrivibrio sp.]